MADSALIQLDLFPAIAYDTGGGRYEPARVVVYNGTLQVWVIVMGQQEPSVAFEAPAISVGGNRLAGYEVLTPDGVVRAISAGGCGCGNKLKTFDPYNGATRMIGAS